MGMLCCSRVRFKSLRLVFILLVSVLLLLLYYNGILPVNGGPNRHQRMDSQGLRTAKPLLTRTNLTVDGFCVAKRKPSGTFVSRISTDLSDWSFQKRVTCPDFGIDTVQGDGQKQGNGGPHENTPSKKIQLQCHSNGTLPYLQVSWTNSSMDIQSVTFGDKCLGAYIEQCCMDGRQVPNIVHYVWFGKNRVEPISFVSFISAVRFMNPCLILFHGEYVPYGRYWDYFIKLFPYVIHVRRDRPTHVYGQMLNNGRHGGDVMRLQALLSYGGVYLDWDQVLLRPIDDLRQHEFTMGLESKQALANGMILSAKNAAFLQLYYRGYRNYTGAWNYNSIQYPYKLSLLYPDLIHVAGYKFFKPFYSLSHQYYQQNYNWSESYAMHFYYIRTLRNEYSTINSIRTVNATIGSVWRHILFGNKELCIN